MLILLCHSSATAAIRRVNHAATGANNGTSWGDAYTQLQTALAGSTSGDQIWVAAGTYKPSTTGTRTQSFVVPSGVALYGGFNGTEALLTQRNVSSNFVILSGDLSGNDNSNLTKTEPTRLDNSHHVLQVLNASSQCIIDGFTIQSGHAEITNTINERGAGILCVSSVLTLNKCVLRSNYARTGAAFNDDVGSSNIAVRGCSFIGNQQQRGGTVAIDSTFDVRNSLFYQNRTSDSPDGYQWGGGLFIKDTTGKVVNCVFAENHATEEGGAVYNHGNTEFINCTFVRNSSSTWSTALHDRTNEAVIKNCVFWGNTGTGLVISNDSRSSGTPAFNAIIQGGYTAAGSTNILNSDPLLQDINDPLGADSIFGTVDDGLHLAASSPAINAGNNSYVPAGVTVDAAESPRLYGTVDLGPYEKVGIKINAHPLPATVQVTMDASFSVSAEGNGTLAYQWRKDEVDIPLANSATLNITAVNKLDEGVYDVEISESIRQKIVASENGREQDGGMAAKTYQPAGYDTDLSDAEWELLKPLIYPADARRGRGRWRDPDSARACLDAIRYVLKTGCQWSLLPRDFPPKSTVHDALARWTQQGLWPRLNEALRTRTRLMLKKTPCPAPLSSTAKASKAGSFRL